MQIFLSNKSKDFIYTDRKQLLHIIHLALQSTSLLDSKKSINILLISKYKIEQINKGFLNHQGATDVITFNYQNDDYRNSLVGEVLVCPQVAKEQAENFNNSFNDELALYIIHGILHLCGFDDQTTQEKKVMRENEQKVLADIRRELRDFNFLRAKS